MTGCSVIGQHSPGRKSLGQGPGPIGPLVTFAKLAVPVDRLQKELLACVSHELNESIAAAHLDGIACDISNFCYSY